jgi:uncharacterized protein
VVIAKFRIIEIIRTLASMKQLGKHIDDVRKLCVIHHVERMHLFGSALQANFNTASDFDFLVRFQAIDLVDYFDNYIGFKEDLEQLLGRQVDIVEEQTLKNPILIKSINHSKELIYG